MGACRCACLGMTAVTETEMDLAVKRVCCLRDQELGTTGPDTLAIPVLNPVSESEGSISQCGAASLPVERWCWRVAAAGHPCFMLKLAQTRSPLLARLLTEMARLHLRACATSRILPAGEVTKLAATSGQYLVSLSSATFRVSLAEAVHCPFLRLSITGAERTVYLPRHDRFPVTANNERYERAL